MSASWDLIQQRLQQNIEEGRYQKNAASDNLIMSDERLKEDIKDINEKSDEQIPSSKLSPIDEFIRNLHPKSFNYKDKQDGTPTKAGIMAQDLEKSALGKSAVVNTPRGKAIDITKLAPMMAGVFSKKLSDLEDSVNHALDKKFKKGKAHGR